MIIDVHTHLPYHKIFAEGFLSGITESMFEDATQKLAIMSKILLTTLNDDKGLKMMKQMDEANIARSVLLIADYGYSLGEAALSIEEIHELHRQVMNAFPERFMVFAGVDPRRGQAGLDLFEKSIRDYKFRGLKLYPPCGFELNDKEVFPLYELCKSYNVPVLTHTGPSLKKMRTEQKYPQSILEVSREFKTVQFILAHGGARDCATTVEVARQRENVLFDISAFQHYADDVAQQQRNFRMFFDQAPDQVLYGSDWPMYVFKGGQRKWIDFIINLDVLSGEELDKLFYKNASEKLSM
ncbi:MAG: amidohydrolase family protein [Cytophagales bacterium]|nr:amidohydrolase family protein [Cytophagales bacterium]